METSAHKFTNYAITALLAFALGVVAAERFVTSQMQPILDSALPQKVNVQKVQRVGH